MRSVSTGVLARAALMLLAPLLAFPVGFIRSGLLDGGDDAIANMPELFHSAHMLAHGEVLWTPDLWMGHPLLGEPEFATLYPPHLLFLLGPPTLIFPAYVILHFLFAEGAAYAYMKRLGLGGAAACFGAVAYAFTGFMLGHRGHTMYVCAGAWAPLVLVLIDRAAERRRGTDFLLAALAFAMLPLCGAVQLTVYLAGTIVVLAAARAFFEKNPRVALPSVLCLVPALLVSALQIAPSLAFSRQLATELRDVPSPPDMSFHPALWPTLFLPSGLRSTELYSRIGVVVLCAAWFAVRGWKAAPPIIRAWVVVAVGSLGLMVGAYVPLVPRFLAAFPVISILRIPVRHNFELGLALSVLGAWGFERARAATTHDVARWWKAGAVIAVLSFVAVRMGAHEKSIGEEAAFVLAQVSGTAVLGALLAFGLWLAAIASRGRASRALWAVVGIAPLLELGWSQQLEVSPFRSFHRLPDVARSSLPERRPLRILPPRFGTANIDSFAGNSVLLHPGVGSVLGYSSIAYGDAIRLFDLDMYGQANRPEDLAWSTLPSLFGVTHVVLPHVVCGAKSFYFEGEGRCAVAPPRDYRPVLRTNASCVVPGTPDDVSYRLETGLRAVGKKTLGVSLGLYSNGADELYVPERELTGVFTEHHVEVHTARFPSFVNFGGLNEGADPIELSHPEFVERRRLELVDLSRPAVTRALHASFEENAVRLEPADQVALVERDVEKPAGAAGAFIQLEARALTPVASDVVFDLYAPGYDSDAAQLVIPGSELGADWVVRFREIPLAGAPGRFSVRLLTAAPGIVEVRRAVFGVMRDSVVSPFPVSRGPAAEGLTVLADHELLRGGGRVGGLLNMPVRAYEVRLDAEVLEPLAGALSFGVARDAEHPNPAEVLHVPPLQIPRRSVLTLAVHEPPETPSLALFSGLSPGPTGTDRGALALHSFEVRDACAVRGYEHPVPLANGLFLYENPRALPRAYTVANAVAIADPALVRSTLRAFEPSDLGAKAVVDEPLPPLSAGRVESASYAPRRADVVVDSPEGPTLLVLNDRFDPDWAASVDGAGARIHRVNGLVRGVVVPRGKHRVRFVYVTPKAVWIGIVAAFLGALFALFVAPLVSRRWQ